MMLNIPRSQTDPFYRYKMPAPCIRYPGGSKTWLVNIVDIATALKVPFKYILKFMGYELGCTVSLKEQALPGRKAENKILRALDKFIEHYVLCQKCDYPEVLLKLDKEDIVKVCNACGANAKIQNGHKVNAYIIKNFVPSETLGGNMLFDLGFDLPNDLTIKEEPNQDDEEDTDDTSEEEEEKIVEECQKPFSYLEQDLLSKAKENFSKYKESKQDEIAYTELVDNLRKDVPVLHWNKIPYLLFNAIFDVNIIKEINKNEALFKKIYNEFEKCDPQFDLLLNLEDFIYVKQKGEDFEKYIPTMLKLFYDVDLLEEDFIKDWDKGKLKSRFMMDFRYQKANDEKFKKAAEPFIEWIKSAEEEDDE